VTGVAAGVGAGIIGAAAVGCGAAAVVVVGEAFFATGAAVAAEDCIVLPAVGAAALDGVGVLEIMAAFGLLAATAGVLTELALAGVTVKAAAEAFLEFCAVVAGAALVGAGAGMLAFAISCGSGFGAGATACASPG
jgi:hypothetical protein